MALARAIHPLARYRVAVEPREDVDKCATLLSEMGASIVRGPGEDTWAPGYYSVLFEDPDGIRLEVNFVPGAGLLAEGRSFGLVRRVRGKVSVEPDHK